MMETMRARNGSTQPNFGYAPNVNPYDAGIQFSDPWARTATTSGQMLASTMAQDNSGVPSLSRPVRHDSMYPSNYNASSYGAQNTSSPQTHAGYGMSGYSQSYDPNANRNMYNLHSQEQDRRLSQPSAAAAYPPTTTTPTASTFMSSPVEMRQRQGSFADYPRHTAASYTSAGRESYNDTLDSARGMVAMSQAPRHSLSALTSAPRTASTASTGSYYPASTSSSISSASSYPYFGSMDSSSTELSSTDGMFDSARPSLPRPAGMIASNMLPHHQSGQATMMSTFSSRVSSSTQKKHKCKICDKRFTRPSSLQTHMYSHTGEKPFACDVEGCGRQFSVVSNLRRHRKVHKGLSDSHHSDNGCGVHA